MLVPTLRCGATTARPLIAQLDGELIVVSPLGAFSQASSRLLFFGVREQRAGRAAQATRVHVTHYAARNCRAGTRARR